MWRKFPFFTEKIPHLQQNPSDMSAGFFNYVQFNSFSYAAFTKQDQDAAELIRYGIFSVVYQLLRAKYKAKAIYLEKETYQKTAPHYATIVWAMAKTTTMRFVFQLYHVYGADDHMCHSGEKSLPVPMQTNFTVTAEESAETMWSNIT